MSDWIGELKSATRQKSAERRADREIALHRLSIVRAKAPAFWAETIEQVTKDFEKLRNEFPENPSLHGQVIQQRDGHLIQGERFPVTVVDVRLNVDGMCVELFAAHKYDSFEQTAFASKHPIEITVGGDERVVFIWRGVRCEEPRQLAEKLIKHVCNIND